MSDTQSLASEESALASASSIFVEIEALGKLDGGQKSFKRCILHDGLLVALSTCEEMLILGGLKAMFS